jgi:hypothetical protein
MVVKNITDNDILGTHLKEIKAKAKTKTIEDLVIRMRIEQSFRRVLKSLGDYVHSEETLPFIINKEKTALVPDFILQKDEIKVIVFLIIPDTQKCTLSREKINDILSYLKKTDRIEVMVVWGIQPDFPSVVLNIDEMCKKLAGENNTFEYLNCGAFVDTLKRNISNKTVVWPVPDLEKIPMFQIDSFLNDFEKNFREAFIAEAARKKPHLDYKKDALETIDNSDIDKVATAVKVFIIGDSNVETFVKNIDSIVRIKSGKVTTP